MDAEPSNASYAETLASVARMLDEEKLDRTAISRMSEESALELLGKFVEKAAFALGLSAAVVVAAVRDIVQIGQNAGGAFVDGFKDGYKAARKVKPRDPR